MTALLYLHSTYFIPPAQHMDTTTGLQLSKAKPPHYSEMNENKKIVGRITTPSSTSKRYNMIRLSRCGQGSHDYNSKHTKYLQEPTTDYK